MVKIRQTGVMAATIALSIVAAGCGSGGSNLRTLPIAPSSAREHAQVDPGLQAVIDWNVIALNTSAAAAPNPPLEGRNIAIVQAAVYDAVVAIKGGYRPYLFALPAARGASVVAAIATASHDTLVSLYPAQQSSLDTAYQTYLGQISLQPNTQPGVAVGQLAAAGMLSRRAADGSSTVVSYTPGTGVGDWQPTPPAFKPALDPGWGKVTPFLLRSGDQFRPAAPPALTSSTYTQDFNEIKNIGDVASTTRTADQTSTAVFWSTTAAQLWNQAVRQLVVAHGFTSVNAARAFAMLNLAGADSFIAAWDAKYTYNQWRPVTAIRNAGSDGNPDTAPDSSWTSLIVTPPFPDYIAGHATYAGAAETILTGIFGSSPGTFQIQSAPAGGLIHRYDSFQAVAEETVNARVWGGIHWRTSCTVGRRVGQAVGAFDLQHGLQPAN